MKETYIEKYTRFSNLVFHNFLFLFLYYFLFILLVFAVAFGHYVLVMIVKKMARKRNYRPKHFARN